MFKSSKPQSLETYLAQIERELRALPSQARADELREIESHLRALVLASQQLEDLSADAATATALRQFGEPRNIGKKLRKSWQRQQPEAWWRVIVAPIVGFALQTILGLLISTLFIFGSYFSLDTQMKNVFPAPITEVISIFLVLLAYAAFAIITGFGVGAVSPKRGIWIITFYVLSTLALLSSELFKAGFADFDNSMAPLLTSFGFFGGLFLLSCLLLLFGNYLGARCTQRLLYRIAPTP